MRINRYFTISISGEIEVSKLTRKIQEADPEVRTESVKLNKRIEGILLSGLSRGKILPDEHGSEIDFQLNVFLFPTGIIIFEVCFEAESIPVRFKSSNFVSEKLVFVVNGERHEDPLMQYSWSFFFKAMQFASITLRMSDINILDDNAQMNIHKTVKQLVMLTTYFLGDETFLLVQGHVEKCSVIIGMKEGIPDDSGIKQEIVIKGEVIKRGNSYYCYGCEEEFLHYLRQHIYRKAFFKFYNEMLIKWLDKVRSQAKYIKRNLNEKNRIYWNKLRNKLEVWDLNYLDFYAATVSMLHQIDEISSPELEENYIDKHRKGYHENRENLLKNMDHIKYSLENLTTPGKAHDEHILQKETEKGNERIMLLSFLAMSIPLLGAILAPGISVMTKITAALVLCLMPVIYMFIRKNHRLRDRRKSNRMYLLSLKESHISDIENTRDIFNSIENDPERSRKSKDQVLALLRESLKTTEKQLNDIDMEIKRS
ncbi:MAG: hypothetical protein K8S62_11060 [Candidatus Sabulitectum sp.]|nr:hypothetical protein [Candidatus Sabulitectum sp.]